MGKEPSQPEEAAGPASKPSRLHATDLGQLRERSPQPLSSPQALGVWELAWPTMVASATATMVRWVDFMMVGSLGPEALAAVGLGGQLYWAVQSIGMLIPVGLTALLARAVGAGDWRRADAALRQALWLSAALGVLATLILHPFTATALAIYGVESSVVAFGSDYLAWLLVGNAPLAVGLVFATALRAAGDSRTPLLTGLLANGVNVFLNWVLIFGNLGAPALGVRGAAIASSTSMLVQLVVLAWLWQSRRLKLRPAGASFRPDRGLCRSLLVIGWPAALEGILFHGGLIWFQRLISAYGTAAIAAYSIGTQILALAFLPGLGFSAAAGTLVGQHLGDHNPEAAARSGWRSMMGAMLAMTALGIAIIALARPIAGLFTNDPRVIELAVDFIWILGAVQPLMAIEFSITGGLRGAGDTFFPLTAIFTGLFICRLIPATVLAQAFEAPIQLVWSALVLDYLAKALLLVWRFRRGRWKTIEL